MFGSEVIEVGIGIALLFFFMSLIASAFCEAVENVLKTRALYLEQGIKELLGRDNAELARRFYEHPLIAALYHGSYQPGSRSLPSYIPRQNFAGAALDILRPQNLVAPLSPESLRASLDTVEATNPVKRVVLTALDSTGSDLTQVRRALEGWYDSAMDRVSGWYKRRNGIVLAGLGLFAAVSLNVDAIIVAKHLLTDEALRSAVVAQAQKTTEAGQDTTAMALTDLKGEFASIGYPVGWAFPYRWWQPYPGPQAGCTPPQTNKTAPAAQAPPATASDETDQAAPPRVCGYWVSAVLSAIPGWIITALAITLGAPFWFDVLNRLMVIRSTVKPTEKSPDEPSQDAPQEEKRGATPPGVAEAFDEAAVDNGQSPGNQTAEAARLAVAEAAFVPMSWATDDPERGLA